jgi:hypothetical protein
MLFSTHVLSTKDASAKQVLVSNATSMASVMTTMSGVLVKGFLYLLSWWLMIMLVFVFFSVVFVSYEETPQVWIGMMKFYNANIGPWVSQVIIVPLYILDLMIKGILPFWNAMVWFWKTMLAQGVLPMLIDQIQLVFQITQALVELMQHVIEGMVDFVQTFDCDASAGCLTNDVQILNVISPMGSLRQAVALSLEISKKFCSYTAVPFDLIFYPILDINLAQGLHHIVNAILHAIVVIPYQSYVLLPLIPVSR